MKWAGGIHKRKDFNRKRDDLSKWTQEETKATKADVAKATEAHLRAQPTLAKELEAAKADVVAERARRRQAEETVDAAEVE